MTRSESDRSFVLILWCAGVLMSGCSKGPTPPQLVPVSGRVVYKGKPVPMASIQFLPDGSQGAPGFAAFGQTKPDGTFTLQTQPYGPGAAPGRYAVTIALEARGQVPDRYADFQDTPLHVEIKEAGAPDLLLTLRD